MGRACLGFAKEPIEVTQMLPFRGRKGLLIQVVWFTELAQLTHVTFQACARMCEARAHTHTHTHTHTERERERGRREA
jgi:hypothetical protein